MSREAGGQKAGSIFNQVVAVAIVVTTLGAAGVEWVRSNAEDAEGAASRSAQILAVSASDAQWRDTQNANADFASYGVTSEYLALEYWAIQKILFSEGSNTAANKELDRYTKLADDASQYGDFQVGVYGPDADPNYPENFYATRQTQADVIAAQQDAQNDHRADWAYQVAAYTAMLAVLAVAVYLLGLSLSLTIPIRRQLAALGIGLFVVSSTWAGIIQIRSPTENSATDLEAAQAYAAGMQAKRTAYLHERTSGYTDAIKYFKQAIALRPRFARAYYELGNAEFAEGSPQRNSVYISVTDDAHLQRSAADLRTALDLGLKDALANLGFDEYLLALPGNSKSMDQGLLVQSIADTRQAINVDPKEPALYYNLAVALLASGSPEAGEAYRQAVKHTPTEDEDVVAGAFTDLGILAGRKPDLAGEVEEIKQSIVAGVWPEILWPSSAGTVHITNFYRYSSGLQVRFNVPGFDPQSDAINFQFYYQETEGQPWAVLGGISGRATVYADTASGPNSYYMFAAYLSQAGNCLPTGNFRIEIYTHKEKRGLEAVRGVVSTASETVKDGSGSSAFRDLEYTRFRDIRMLICRPSDWRPATIGADLGFIKGYTSGDGGPDSSCALARSCGVYLVRYQYPSIKATDSQLFSDLTAEFLSDEGLFPSKLRSQSPSGALGVHWYSGMEPGYTDEWYDYPGGRVLITAGMLADHSMVVGVVFGPQSFFDTSRAFRVYESISNY